MRRRVHAAEHQRAAPAVSPSFLGATPRGVGSRVIAVLPPVLRRIIRLSLFVLGIIYGLLIAPLAFFRKHPEPIAGHWFRLMARVIGLHIQVEGTVGQTPLLLVGNHISWLDILVIGGSARTLFVSKADVQGWPIVSFLARAGRTLYIERGAHGTAELRKQMHDHFGAGYRVTIFPEGTTTDGQGTRRFQPRLFAVAIDYDIPVQVFALHYRNACAAYIDEVSLLDVLWNCTAEARTDVHLRFGPILPRHDKRDDYARAAQIWATDELQAFHRDHPRYAS